MPAAIWAFLLFVLPSLIKFIFSFLGIGIISFIALDFIVDNVKTLIFANYNNLATDVVVILSMANVDTAINIILASYTAGITIKTTISSTKRFRFEA